MLEGAGIENAQREAEWLIEAGTGLGRAELADAPAPTPDEESRVLALAARRVGGEPLQYVTGIAGFRRLELRVGPGVFIPRPETELAAERAMAHLSRGGVVIEIGTGSGALALSIADERPDAAVWATEYSEEATGWAIRNREDLGLDVNIVRGDLFEGLPTTLHGTVDVVVSNPPYIPEGFQLAREILDFEPHVALFADDAGLAVIRRLAEESPRWLKNGGWLLMEISEAQRDAVRHLLEDCGYCEVEITLDLTGRARIAEARWMT